MKGWLISPLLIAACALGCDPRGVSLGSQEQCVLDPRFATVDVNPTDEQGSNCAQLGDNVLLNSGFETPVVEGCPEAGFCQFPAANVGITRISAACRCQSSPYFFSFFPYRSSPSA